jgi:5-methylcytosine-specific restriction endonuclease McrA
MPIRPENRALYPPNWREISASIRKRANHHCEECGLRNYSVGYRDRFGGFVPLAGSGPCDAAGMGRRWPDLNPISYREALELARASNTEADGRDADGRRYLVIVLTVAHLDHDPRNCDPSNLRALCQRCHLRYDIEHHGQTAYRTRRAGRALELFDTPPDTSTGEPRV